jgi:hypothetical protein
MDDFYKLFRRDAMDTSVAAAASIYPDLRRIQLEVLTYAKNQPNGFTDEEMNEFFGTHRSTYRARRSELVTRELVIDSGKRKAMRNGRNATVWICPEFTYPQKSLALEI